MRLLRPTVLALLLILSCASGASAAAMNFGSDLLPGPNLSGFSGTYTYFQLTPRTAPATTVPVTAPQSGVIVKITLKYTGSGTVKYRIISGPSVPGGVNYSSRSAFRAGGPTQITVAGSPSIYSPVDGTGDPAGVPVAAGERIGFVMPTTMSAHAGNTFTNGEYLLTVAGDHVGTGADYQGGGANRELTLQATVEPDTDGDTYGDDSQDACDGDSTAHEAPCPSPDSDNDGVLNNDDNCPGAANADQKNTDGDTEGDACDADDDNDTLLDGPDNCDTVSNTNQADLDADGAGDVCDADDDGDGVADTTDNCPVLANASQTNTDKADGGDACDPDDDNDTVLDGNDNCDRLANLDQKNTDGAGDGGDACDADDDNDGVDDSVDAFPLDPTRSAAPVVEKINVSFLLSVKKGKTTLIKSFQVTKLFSGSTITMTCATKAKGCPFTSKTIAVPKGGIVTLTSHFKKRKLKTGTVVIVTVAKPGAIGRRATYRTRAKKVPTRKVTCLSPVGATVAC